ncbi:MAG TPA: hypothetical protein DCQ50_21425 [Chryseobacterium sp.]|nr:hypothetical protein [Chryseobacterium sp.]
MSASTFKILKQCHHCGNMFEAQKVTTAYCSHKCNSAHYKLKKKLERRGVAEAPISVDVKMKPRTSALNKALLKDKDFLNAKEVSVLLECSLKTVYSLIHTKRLKATNIGKKRFIIPREHLNTLFELN